MRICGVDPGLNNTGYGVIDVGQSGQNMSLVEAGVVRTSAQDPLSRRLVEIEEAISEVLTEYRPDLIGLEELYSHYRHPRTAILMGHARGVLLLAAAQQGIEVMSIPANRVKRVLTGNGHASKTQMQQAIMTPLNLSSPPEPADVADALAIALCAGIQYRADEIRTTGGGVSPSPAGREVPTQ